jgi:Zn2+/Cd2+-exporting ATPase
MGEGAAIAMEMSDVTLMDSSLEKLVYVLKMGKRVMHTVQENIVLSLLCKLAVVGLTFAGSMTLLFAIASDVGVMLLVTLNGLKLLPRERSEALVNLRRKRYTQVEMQDPVREIV